jgi:molybdopterin-containing oxidoreductase family iron-sulfur binding subunit
MEFASGLDAPPESPTRRRFLQLMGASVALAAAGCSKSENYFLPLSTNIPEQLPGVPEYYASALEVGGVAQGVLVTSYDGRPIRVDGNPDHPQNRGGSNSQMIASVLELYDPDRSRGVVRFDNGKRIPESWDAFASHARQLIQELARTGGVGLRVLAEESSSEALAALRDRFLKAYPQAAWHEYEPVSRDEERQATKLSFGQPLRIHYALDKADVIACLDDDLLAAHPASVKHSRDFASRRRPEDGAMNRLYVVEPVLSSTGAAADHRLSTRYGRIASFAERLEAEVNRLLDAPAAALETAHDSPAGDAEAKFLAVLASDLVAAKGKSIVTIGVRQPAAIQGVAHRINQRLGNVGQTVTYTEAPRPDRPLHVESIKALADDMGAGKVEILLILGGNPVYDAPADLDFGKKLEAIKQTVHLSNYEDETSLLSKWHVNRAHQLESWGDARSYDGVYTVIQPMIAALYGGKSPIELLALFAGDDDAAIDGQKLVREAFNKLAGSTDEAKWRTALDLGLLEGSAAPAVTPELKTTPPEHPREPGEDQGLDLILAADSKIYDGRFANNAWLQELPDFITKITWDNAALVSPATARQLGLKDGYMLSLTAGGKQLLAAAAVIPGIAENTVALALGYGRSAAGVVGGDLVDGVETVGFNAYRLRTTSAMDVVNGLKVEPTGRTYKLALTQDHHAMDAIGSHEREHRLGEIIKEGTAAEFAKEPEAIARGHEHGLPELPLFDAPTISENHKWGMAVDLSKCVGCNACVIACQSENNIPVVGKEQVFNGREMHWLRIDRYFKGDPEAPEVVSQPVACVQCENAPCEQVCPVAATMHDHDGLNAMVYNRCIGTRYCSNNCPFKVRRFNFFNYHKALEQPEMAVAKLKYNPDVTIRARGVMEKCTYCTQRIQTVKIKAKNEGREIGLEEVTPACAQACSARAITFGDLNKSESKVAKDHANPRSYTLLQELNVKPRTAYLARIRNPHPALAETEGAHEHSA